jgi:CheY-like chemotaxis protein
MQAVPKILIVEDNDNTHEGLKLVLSELDYRVEAVSTVSEALQAISWFVPDVVVSDMLMPLQPGDVPNNSAGLELLKRVRATKPEIKFLMI